MLKAAYMGRSTEDIMGSPTNYSYYGEMDINIR